MTFEDIIKEETDLYVKKFKNKLRSSGVTNDQIKMSEYAIRLGIAYGITIAGKSLITADIHHLIEGENKDEA